MRQFSRMGTKIALATLLSFVTPSTGNDQREQIVFHVRPIGIVCAGICPWFELTVSRRGTVVARYFRVADQTQNDEAVSKTRRFRVNPEEAEKFFAYLAPLRPSGMRQFGRRCNASPAPDDPTINHGVNELQIRWNGTNTSVRLNACMADGPVREASERALIAISVDPHSGARLTRGTRAWWKDCLAKKYSQFC
jgi:hypothetical protein